MRILPSCRFTTNFYRWRKRDIYERNMIDNRNKFKKADIKNFFFVLPLIDIGSNSYQLRVSVFSSIFYLMSWLRFLVEFNRPIHSNLQSHFQGLFFNSTTGVRCIKERSSTPRVSRPQSFIKRRCNRGNTMPIRGQRLSWTSHLQPINDNVSRLVRFSRSFSASDVKFDMWFSRSSRNCGRYKLSRLVTCVPDKINSVKPIGNRGIVLIGFQDRSKVDKFVKVLKKSDEKYGADMFLKSRCFNARKFQNALSCIPSPTGLEAKDKYSRIWKKICRIVWCVSQRRMCEAGKKRIPWSPWEKILNAF